jgi:hypothetical protein
MRKIGACLAITLFATAALSPTPSPAFGLSIGPFHIGLPFFGFHHRLAPHRRLAALHNDSGVNDKATVGSANSEEGAEPAVLYPTAALPGLYDAVFWPARAPDWPFGYDAIFRSAFAKSAPDDIARICQEPDRTKAIVERIGAEVRPRRAQISLLQQLGQALGMASGYLTKACPTAIPAQPVARLQFIQSQIQVLSMAIDLVRPPLQQFQQSLDARQRARFSAMGSNTASDTCGAEPVAINWSIEDIDQSVQPNDTQRDALAELRKSFASIAVDLHAHCPNPLPGTPLARLQAIESRLDSSWRAALAMQVALAKFENALNEDQRGRFETMTLAQTQ